MGEKHSSSEDEMAFNEAQHKKSKGANGGSVRKEVDGNEAASAFKVTPGTGG